MRSAYGAFSLSSSPTRAKRRIVAQCPVRRSCFYRIGRKRGGADEWQGLPSDVRSTLRQVRAVYVSSEEGPKGGYPWFDWFRIPLDRGATLNSVAQHLANNGLHDGPHYGTGRETMPTGSGAEAKKRKSDLLAIRERAERRGDWPTLVCVLFGDVTAPLRLPQKDACDYPRTWDAIAFWEDDKRDAMKTLTIADWMRLCKTHPQLSTVWNHVERMLSDTGSVEWAIKAKLLEEWVIARVKGKGKLVTKIGHDDARSIMRTE